MEVPYPDHRAVCCADNTDGITVSVVQSHLMTTQCLNTTTTKETVCAGVEQSTQSLCRTNKHYINPVPRLHDLWANINEFNGYDVASSSLSLVATGNSNLASSPDSPSPTHKPHPPTSTALDI